MRPESHLGAILSSDEVASPVVEFHEETEIYRTQFDLYTRTASEAIITAMTAATGKDPLELPPLYSIVDSDTLDTLEASVHDDSDQPMTITFEYAGCRVSVRDHGTVSVDPDPENRPN